MVLIKRQELRETVYKWLSTTLKVREYLQNGEWIWKLVILLMFRIVLGAGIMVQFWKLIKESKGRRMLKLLWKFIMKMEINKIKKEHIMGFLNIKKL